MIISSTDKRKKKKLYEKVLEIYVAKQRPRKLFKN